MAKNLETELYYSKIIDDLRMDLEINVAKLLLSCWDGNFPDQKPNGCSEENKPNQA